MIHFDREIYKILFLHPKSILGEENFANMCDCNADNLWLFNPNAKISLEMFQS